MLTSDPKIKILRVHHKQSVVLQLQAKSSNTNQTERNSSRSFFYIFIEEKLYTYIQRQQITLKDNYKIRCALNDPQREDSGVTKHIYMIQPTTSHFILC